MAINIAYDDNSGSFHTITWGMTNPTSDVNLLVGRESTVVDNSTDLFVDVLVGGTFTGPATGMAAGVIEIWSYAQSFGNTDYTAECTGTDGALTLVDETKLLLKPVTEIRTNLTASEVYEWGPFSIRRIYGEMPKKWGLWGTQSSGGALGASTTKYLGIEFTST